MKIVHDLETFTQEQARWAGPQFGLGYALETARKRFDRAPTFCAYLRKPRT